MTNHGKIYQWQRLDNCIYEIVLLESCNEAVDGWLRVVEYAHDHALPGETLLFLLDVSRGMQPLAYTLQQMAGFSTAHPRRNPARTAFLYSSGFLINLVSNVINSVTGGSQRDVVRFFHVEDHSSAIHWLLEGQMPDVP